MNDDQLITAVKESVTGVHMHVPTEQIVSRSRAVRARRRIPGLAAALAVAAGTAVAVTALLPASHQPSHQPSVQLAAWTVAKEADGTVSVTIRELHDPAGLQRRLRADGVPASVTFFGQLPRSCQRYSAGTARINRVFTLRHTGRFPVMVIHPSALPGGAGVEISPPAQQPIISVAIGLVRASPQCTGS
jgi:murein DD-endopeptidase MepM/ murein hydrolase activator NlpD